ncbi:thioredoxin family protein [Litoribacter alkaliphilus]|uniref:Thioredoxin family protein n=1 Tax=Litoribacter ruber TaxID=702568 RepID=A0AAP2CJN5_9BACT|nr:thioredoxin family protein [Litoribacter alkaliphilus]MBS9525991.1 thioredoxin family protein [Litoribacter alkaliphilus]
MKKRMIFFFLGLVCLIGRVEIVVGQEVAAHPKVSSKTEGAPVVVYGEIVSFGPIEELSVKAYLDYYYDAFVGTGIVNEPLALEKGNIYLGQVPANTRSFTWVSPPVADPIFVSFFQPGRTLMDNYLMSPGDTAYVKINMPSLTLNFGGPAGKKLFAQSYLKAYKGNQILDHPLSLITDREQVYADEFQLKNFENANAVPHRESRIFSPGTEPIGEVVKIEESKLRGLLEELSRFEEVFSASEFKAMEVAATAERDLRILAKIELALQFNTETDPSGIRGHALSYFNSRYGALPDYGVEESILGVVPAYIDLIVQWSRTSAKAESGEAIKSLYSLPPSIARDKAIAGRLIRFFNSIASAEEEIHRARMHVESERVLRDLDTFVANRKAGGAVMDFEFVDEQGSLVTWKDFEGKVVVLDFWISGCSACLGFYKNTLSHIQEEFADNPDVEVVTVSVDKKRDTWLKSLSTGKYTSSDAVNLHTDGYGGRHPFLIKNAISGYPFILILDAEGRVFRSGKISYDPEDMKKLIMEAVNDKSLTLK